MCALPGGELTLEQLSKTLPIIGIAYKDKPDDTTGFLQQYGNPFREIGMDADGRTGLAWGLYGVPETYLIDRAARLCCAMPDRLTKA